MKKAWRQDSHACTIHHSLHYPEERKNISSLSDKSRLPLPSANEKPPPLQWATAELVNFLFSKDISGCQKWDANKLKLGGANVHIWAHLWSPFPWVVFFLSVWKVSSWIWGLSFCLSFLVLFRICFSESIVLLVIN